MRQIAFFAAVLVVLALAAPAARAADVSGTWKSKMETPRGTFESTFVLKQEGEKLTGTVSGRGGNTSEIKDGKVNGDEVEFSVERRRRGGDGGTVLVTYKGKVNGDKIEGATQFGEQSREWLATREK